MAVGTHQHGLPAPGLVPSPHHVIHARGPCGRGTFNINLLPGIVVIYLKAALCASLTRQMPWAVWISRSGTHRPSRGWVQAPAIW